MPVRSRPAAKEQLFAFFADLEAELEKVEFFRPPEKRYRPWVERCHTQMHGALSELDRACQSRAGDWLIGNRLTLAASTIGGIKETQEMLDFCAKHNIVSDIEMIRMDQINDAYERMLKGDVKYRFVIDMATLKAA